MKLAAYVYNKVNMSKTPKRIENITEENGIYTATDKSGATIEFRVLNAPRRLSNVYYDRFCNNCAVLLDEDDNANSIWFYNVFGSGLGDGVILERYTYGSHMMMIVYFEGKLLKLNSRLQTIPFMNASIKSNNVVSFSCGEDLCSSPDLDSIRDNKYLIDKKMRQTEELMEQLTRAKEILTGMERRALDENAI